MKKVVIITLNTAYDLVGRLPRLQLGEVNSVETLGLFAAGKGINVAKVLHDLGVSVAVGGFMGNDNSGGFERLFDQLQWQDYFHRVAGQTRVNVKITETDAEVTDLNFSGYQIQPQDWQRFVRDSLQYCAAFDVVAVGGSLPQGVSPTQFADWLTELTALGVKVVLDSSNAAFMEGIKAKPWLVKPNHKELETWYGKPLNSLEDIIVAGTELQKQGIANVVVSMGSQGALYISEQEIIHAEALPCEHIISTVGAGDSMVAGLIYGELNGFSLQKSLAFSTAVSTLALSQSNVGIADLALVEELAVKTKLQAIERK
ncbi:1-phosphofructokinase [Pasteurellaceae bacterium 22721_9_1]